MVGLEVEGIRGDLVGKGNRNLGILDSDTCDPYHTGLQVYVALL